MTKVAGFWSYVHDDDSNDGGGILRLARHIAREFELLSSEPLDLFIDRDDLRWGQEWKRRIDESLQEITFFIPVITPSYFRSQECRRELVKFRATAESLGVERLLLPIYYVNVPEMEVEEPSDQLIAEVKSAQMEDMRGLRLVAETDSSYRERVNELAARLIEIVEQTEADAPDPAGASVVVPSELSNLSPEDGPQDSFQLEDLAAGERALPEWNQTVQALGSEIEVVGEITEEATRSFEAENDSGKATFVSRLRTANRLAERLEAPADRMLALGQDYAAQLLAVDPAIQTLIRAVREDVDARNSSEAKDLFQSIRGATKSSREATAQLADLSSVMDQSAGLSRELRRPIRKMQTALRNVVDAQKVLDDWEAQINDLYEQ